MTDPPDPPTDQGPQPAGDAGNAEGDELPAKNPVPLGIRLFLIPFLIVGACGLVLLIGRMLSTEQRLLGSLETRTLGPTKTLTGLVAKR